MKVSKIYGKTLLKGDIMVNRTAKEIADEINELIANRYRQDASDDVSVEAVENSEYERLKEEFNSYSFKRTIKAIKGDRCIYCGGVDDIEYHHIIPLSQGGDNRPSNIVPLCKRCHMKAHKKQPIEGKTYKPKGRPLIKEPDNFNDVVNKYLDTTISLGTALDESGLKRQSFYRLLDEWIDRTGDKRKHRNKGRQAAHI